VKSFLRSGMRLMLLMLVCGVALQLFFLGRIALMIVVDPQSTTFQRSEAWRLLVEKQSIPWHQEWKPYGQISNHLKRAVIASEDANFSDHSGVEWDALEKAWERNQRAEARAEKQNERLERRMAKAGTTRPESAKPIVRVQPKVVGGSTITQQLAKNLFLGSERSLSRKGQEFIITLMLEALLSKQRLLEIYLNNVEWGEGLFGAEAAAQNYFRTTAAQLGPGQAARLAVMLPAPKRFEKRPGSAYVSGRAGTVMARMNDVELP
jgi:monofunctional biosynthetic peptidoglycan transglycosylase